MAGVNKVIIVGNLGRDPEVKYFQDGTAVCNFSVATSDEWNDKNTGEKRQKTEWHRVVTFRKLAEVCGQYLSKGRQVYVEGKLQTREWEGQDGIKRYSTEVVANTVQFLGSKGDAGQQAGGGFQGNYQQGGGGALQGNYQQPGGFQGGSPQAGGFQNNPQAGGGFQGGPQAGGFQNNPQTGGYQGGSQPGGGFSNNYDHQPPPMDNFSQPAQPQSAPQPPPPTPPPAAAQPAQTDDVDQTPDMQGPDASKAVEDDDIPF